VILFQARLNRGSRCCGKFTLPVLCRPVVGQGVSRACFGNCGAAEGRGLRASRGDREDGAVRSRLRAGGFQGRVDTLLEELKKLGDVLKPLTDAS
jgi:hypothetical protein